MLKVNLFFRRLKTVNNVLVMENDIFGITSSNGVGKHSFCNIADILYIAGFGKKTFNGNIQKGVFRDFMCKAL